MTRLFARGELKLALLHVTAEVGPANGYTIMQGLGDRIGGSWRPSPGAIYPALLSLEDAGLLAAEEAAGTRLYDVTASGRVALERDPDVLADVAGRAKSAPVPPTTAGALLDSLAAEAPHRDLLLSDDDVARLERLFQPLIEEINRITAATPATEPAKEAT